MSVSRSVTTERLRAQLLTPAGQPTSPEAVVDRLLAVQAQDHRAFRLALRARCGALAVTDVDAALTERRSLVVAWLCRGTLHLVRPDDYWWLHELTAPRQVTGNTRRLAQLGVSESAAERGVAAVVAAVAGGPKTRAELREVLHDAGVPTDGQALVHVLSAASIREHLVRGPVLKGEHCFVDARIWLQRPKALDRSASLTRLAHRYLAGHGPASAEDLAAYCGITLTDARSAFELVAEASEEVEGSLRRLRSDQLAPADDPPPPRLLGMFDPVLHGWADRTFVTGSHSGVVTTNGLFRATALVDGQVVGTWKLADGRVTLSPFAGLTPQDLAALEEEAADVLCFLGLPQRAWVVAAP